MELTSPAAGIVVNEDDCTYSIYSIISGGKVWQAQGCPLLAVRDVAAKTVTPVRGSVSARKGAIVLETASPRKVRMTLRLQDNRLRVRLDEPSPAGADLPARMRAALADPPLQILGGLFAMGPAQQAGLVLPILEGIYVPASAAEVDATLRLYFVMGLSMGFWGVVRAGQGSVVGFCDSAYAQFHLSGGASGQRWTLEALRHPQDVPLEMEVRFIDGEQPLDAAKEFRRYEREHKTLTPLSQRALALPALNNLVGGANVKFVNYIHSEGHAGNAEIAAREETFSRANTFAGVADLCGRLKADGIDRVTAFFWGWGADGYDRLHPDILPACPWAGGDPGLRAASDRIRAMGFTAGGHDNYQDIYQAAPSFGRGETVALTPQGELQAGGFWAGGQCYIQCSAEANRFAHRNLPLMKERYGWDALFIDTVTAAFFYECHSPNHPRSKEDDRRDKIELMEYARGLFGVFGSEAGQSWGAEFMDYWEGFLHIPLEQGGFNWWGKAMGARPLPIFGAVYRDVLLAYQHQSCSHCTAAPLIFLASLRSAQPPYYFFQEGFYDHEAAYVRKSYEVLAHLNRCTIDAVIVDHQWLSPDGLAEQTTLSDGTIIVTNSSPNPFAGRAGRWDIELPAYGFFVHGPQMVAMNAVRIGPLAFAPLQWVTLRRQGGQFVVFSETPLMDSQDQALREMMV